jgi:hypothetical protein
MEKIWKPACLLGLIALAAVTLFACTVPSPAPPPEVMRLVLPVCVMLSAGGAAGIGNAASAKRHTAATGF